MLANTSDDLDTIFRSLVDDVMLGDPPTDDDRLWKETDVYNYMTEAVDTVARRTLGLFKTIEIPVVANTQLYSLPAYVLDIRYARLLTAARMLHEHNVNDYSGFKDDDYGQSLMGSDAIFTTTGTPTQFMRDYDARGIRLIPIPTDADTLELQCCVTLQAPISAGMPLPFSEAVDERLLLLKMQELAYGKHDADTYNAQLAQQFGAEFEAKVVDRASEWRRIRRKPGVVRMEL